MKKKKIPAGLFWSLVVRIAPISVIVFAGIGYVVVTRSTESAAIHVQGHHMAQHQYVEAAIERKFNSLKKFVRVLAVNDLVVNGLIDMESRDQYLSIFFRSLRIPDSRSARITLVDYKGRSVITNQGLNVEYDKEPFWQTVANGGEHFEVTAKKLVFCVPVLYQGLTEGAVIVEIDAGQFAIFFTVEASVDAVLISDRNGGSVFLYPPARKIFDDKITSSEDWFLIHTILDGFDSLVIETGVIKEGVMGPVKSLEKFLVLSICLNIMALLASLFIAGRIVTGPVAGLISGIQNIMQNLELTRKIEETGPRELQMISLEFNRLVSQLQTTMVSRSNLDRMFNAMTESVLVTDLKGEIQSANPASINLFGCPESRLIGLQMNKLLKVDDSQNILTDVLDTGSVTGREIFVQSQHGKELTLLHSCSVIPAEAEMLITFIHVFHDITQSHQDVLALEAERQRLNLVIEGTRTGLWEWNVQTGETIFNERWAEIAGYTLDELAPLSIQTWMDLCQSDDLEKSNEALNRHFSGKEEFYNCECRMRHKEGGWVWVLDRGKVLEWTMDGKPVRMAGTHIDITDRKKAENELHHANERLEQRVWERTQELKNMQSQMLMQEKMASVGQLAAGIAHELNNPINFVRTNFATLFESFTDLAEIMEDYRKLVDLYETRYESVQELWDLRDKASSLQIDYILDDLPALFDESEKGFTRITRIIQSMRDFSHSDHQGKITYFNINKGIEDTLVIAKNVYKYHADLKTDLGELPEIPCLPERLNQVFLNLIVNSSQAIETRPQGGKGQILIRTWQEDDLVCFEIQDDGPGISPDFRSRIFEPFFTTKAPGKGTGLGLSISYDIIVHKHKGEMLVDCPESGGTVFTIKLPVNDKFSEANNETG